MHFVRIGEFLAASRITGPRHNLLQIKLGSQPQETATCEVLPPQGSCVHEPLNELQVVASVIEGVAEANQRFGTHYSVTHIKYVRSDTKPEAVYALLALEIIKHLEDGGEFVQGANQNAL
jgi:hypothetical protein